MNNKYSRQILLREIGAKGQEKLKQAKVAVIGIGALGTVAAELLVRAGVENLMLIDRDVIEESNLQRQSLFTEKEVGKSKAETAKQKLKEINSSAKIEAQNIHLNSENINIFKNVDLILDCTDNLETRFLINDFCKKEKIVWIYAAAIKTEGYVLPIFPDGPCLRCFLKEASLDTCAQVGVLNTITFSIASLQATLALQILVGEEVKPELLYYNIWKKEFKKLKVKKNPACPTCQGKYFYLEKKEEKKVRQFCSSGRFQILGKAKSKQEWLKLKEKWSKLDLNVLDDGVTLRFKNIMLFKDGRALITANSEQEAQAVYSEYVGN